jgi:tetratricopeptide (TPR) repeat protein
VSRPGRGEWLKKPSFYRDTRLYFCEDSIKPESIMTHHRRLTAFLIPISCLVATASVAQEVPEKAMKYHEALMKRPHNAALFDRFFGAWIDDQPVEALEAFLNARALAKGGQDWTVLAIYQLRRGKEEAALAALGKGIEAVPDDAALLMERAKLRLRRLEFGEARTDLAKVAAGKDEVLALEAAKLAGKSWLREGKTAEAIKAWDDVLAAHPNDEDLLEDLVETAAAESEMVQALVYADKLVATTRDSYQKTLRMLRRGDLLAQAGRHDEAVEAYSGTFNQVGEGSWLEREVLAQIEKVFRGQDRIDDLSAQLKKLAEAYPQRLLIHRQLAKLEAVQGEADAAIGRFREVLKRSPGDKELREEFVRLLVDGDRIDDAVAELEKLIELSPADSGLYLQVAAMRFRQGKPELVLAALNKAHELLGKDEGNGIRIAGHMLQYQLKDAGEALLKELGAAAGAGPAAMEALAAQYGRTDRKPEAVELLKKAAAGDDVDVLLRNAGSIFALGENAVAFETLMARNDKFSADPRFLAALAQGALAANKPEEAVPQSLKLVRMARQSSELAESINLASRIFAGADKVDEISTALAAQPTRSAAETCLLATLIEDRGDFVAVGKLLDADPDTQVLLFHAALLDRRGEFDAAIGVISRLADTEEGKKTAYFKDLSELQQRAGKIPEALATVERWKLSAPGDKTAWITGSRLLRESGKPNEAVKMTRQAVARFEGDSDLAASLASLHDEAGQWQDAEAIYWKLYDESQSPADQARWAVQLAQLAQRTAKTDELEEKLRERARGNRKSTGPILALAELARVTNNEDKRRDLLLEAVRLQPKDLDLRLQIASLEDQSGNPERVVALLEEALPYDANGRVRSALAQAYLRQGQAVKGMRELRLLAGKAGFDPRAAESAAAALAGAKLHDEAITFLRTELADGGDWRSRYLLGTLLEEDGREAEALPIFMDLLQAQGEIPKLVLPTVPVNQNYLDQFSAEVRAIFRLVTANQAAYTRDNNRSGIRYSIGQSATVVGNYHLPNTVADVRQFALVHLVVLSKKKNVGAGESIIARLKAAGIGNAAFIADLAGNTNPAGNQRDLVKLLENYPDEPGLFEFVMSYGGSYGGQGADENLLRRILERSEKLSPVARFNAWAIIATKAKPEDPAWALMCEAAQACIADKAPASAQTITYRLMYLLQGQQGICPEIHRAAVRELLLAAHAKTVKDEPKMARNYYSLAIVALGENPDVWVEAINTTIRESRKAAPTANNMFGYRTRFGQIQQQVSRNSSRGNNNPWNSEDHLFELPTIGTVPVRSIPMQVIMQFSPDRGYMQSDMKPLLTPADMVKRSAQIESPYLRAWLAVKAEDKAAIAKAMAVVPSQEEACDFEMLRAVLATQDKKLPEAFASLLKARAAAGSDREMSGAISMFLIGVAGGMTPEERAGLAEEIEATFLQTRQAFGVLGAQVLAAQARKLGLEELANRIEPVARPAARGGKSAIAAAAIAGSSSTSSSSGGSTDRIQKLLSEKKYDAAARETMQAIRALGTQNGASYYQYQMRNLLERLGKEGTAELLKLVEPGESKSLVKRLEYADICRAVGQAGQALAVLEALAKERPDDVGIAARLTFSIPADQMDRRLAMMTKSCMEPGFVDQASSFATILMEGGDAKQTMEFFETVTCWLETTDPNVLADANLTWATYSAKDFFDGDSDLGLPSLLPNGYQVKSDKPVIERHKALCGRLARALMRHDSCAEAGFRLLAAPADWKIDPTEMDGWARQALLASATPAKSGSWQSNHYNFFTLVRGDGGSSSGDDLSELSSASWLAKRLDSAKSPAEVFPPGFIAEIKQLNPKVGDLLVTLSRELKSEDLAAVWESDPMKSNSDRFGQMFRPLALKRMAAVPEATKFFVDKISAIKPGEAMNRNGSRDQNRQLLFVAAITCTAMGKPGELDAVARAISKAIFGEKIEFTDATGQTDYHRVNFMDSITRGLGNDALLLVRYQSAFFRLGVPVSQSGSFGPFQDKRFAKAEDAETFLESLGWLSDADRWEPYVSMNYDRSSAGNGVTIRVQPVLLLNDIFLNMNLGSTLSKDLVARLKERKTGRFGSLMIAAALSSGKDRSTLAGQAFTESAATLAKLPPERMASLAMVLPWLPEDVGAKLPETFRLKLKVAESKKREEAIAAADKFIASLKSQGTNDGDDWGQVVSDLISYDFDKAVEVFVAGEQAYTDSLSRGGNYSYSSSGDWQYSIRDQSLYRITQSEDSGPFTANPKLRLRFIDKILASPTGKRLSWSYYENYQSVFSIAAPPLMKTEKPNTAIADVVEMVQAYKALEPELKAVAYPCFLLAKRVAKVTEDVKQRQEIVAKLARLIENDPQAARLATVRLAPWSWKICTPEEKTATRLAITSLFTDGSIPDVARVMIAADLLGNLPKEEILDAAGCAALVRLYQDYCAGERTAITHASDNLFSALVRTPLRDEPAVALYKSLAQAFWGNTALPKTAGHPQIPASLAQSTFIAAVLGNDSELVAKTFPRIKPLLSGKLVPMVSLIQLRQMEFAKQIAPIPAAAFEIETSSLVYDKALEESLAVFKQSGIDAPTLQKLEFELLDFAAGKEADTPVESPEERTERLIASFTTTAPHDSVVPAALRSLLRRSPAHPALLAALDAWVNGHPAGKWVGGEEGRGARGSSRAREAGIALHGIAAMHSFATGDTTRLKALQDAAGVPTNNRNNSGYRMSNDVIVLIREMARTIWNDVCVGNTAGYKDGLTAWNDFIIQCAGPIGYNSNQIDGALAASHFLACWTGDPAAFDRMCERLPEKTAGHGKKFNRQNGFTPFVKFVSAGRYLDNVPGTISREVFLPKALGHSGFVTSCPRNIDWVENLASQGQAETIDKLMENPPASLVPELLPPLYGYHARYLREKKPVEALAVCRKALELCPDDAANKFLRGALKLDLADLLFNAKQADEAKKTLASLTPEEIPDDMRASYLELAKKLEVKPVVTPLPPKKSETDKKK